MLIPGAHPQWFKSLSLSYCSSGSLDRIKRYPRYYKWGAYYRWGCTELLVSGRGNAGPERAKLQCSHWQSTHQNFALVHSIIHDMSISSHPSLSSGYFLASHTFKISHRYIYHSGNVMVSYDHFYHVAPFDTSSCRIWMKGAVGISIYFSPLQKLNLNYVIA